MAEERRLDSWKEIATHLNREVRTVQRWEKEEGLPVHRHAHKKLGSVYAYVSEIDGWSKNRRALLEGEPQGAGPKAKLWWLAAAAVVAAGAGVLAWRLLQRPAAVEPLVLTQLTTDTGLTYQPALSPDGKLLAYASDRSGQGNLDIYVQQLPREEPIRLTSHEADDFEPSFSPDGTRVVFASERDGGGIYVVPTLGGDARKIGERGRRPRFSPDGQWIAYWAGSPQSAGSVFVAPTAGGQPRRLLSESVLARSPVWTPEGKHLLCYAYVGWRAPGSSDSDWWVAPLDGRPPTRTGAFEVFRHHGLKPGDTLWIFPELWRPGANQVVFSARSGDSINLWKVSISPKTWHVEGEPQRLTFGSGLEQHASVAGARLVFSSLTRNLDIWSLPVDSSRGKVAGELKQLTQGASEESSPSISDDGKRMVFESNRTGKPVVWTKNLETGKERVLTDTLTRENLPRISHDGSRVAYSIITGPPLRGEIYVVPYDGGAPAKVCDGCMFPTDWSQDGARILCQGVDQADTILLLNRGTGAQVKLLEHPKWGLWNGQFSPDGRWIAFSAVTDPGLDSRQFLAPFRDILTPSESEWIPLDFGGKWSPDGNLRYSTSQSDGFRCIWAARVDPATKQSVGPPLDIYHFHRARHNLFNVSDPSHYGLSIARDKIVFTLGELTGNIWMAQPQ